MRDEVEFLQIKGGWISPYSIDWAETSKHNELMLVVGLAGRDKPVHLNEQDSALVRQYLNSHTWQPNDEEEEGEYPLQGEGEE